MRSGPATCSVWPRCAARSVSGPGPSTSPSRWPVRGSARRSTPPASGPATAPVTTAVRSARFLDAGRQPVMVFVAEYMDGSVPGGTLTVRDHPAGPPAGRGRRAAGRLVHGPGHSPGRPDRFGITASPGWPGATWTCPPRSGACAMGNAIPVSGLARSYGAVQAVRGVSFTVGRGEIFALLGPNGAGKTTTLEILEGFRGRDAGQVEVLGLDPGDRATGRALRERIGLVLQDIAVEPYLTVRETLARNAGYYPSPRDVGEVIALVGLAGQERKKVRTLSGGLKRRLDLGLGLIGDPDAAVPGRADDRVRPGRPAGRVGDRARPPRPRDHDHAHHALHGRGPGAGRPGRGDVRRPDRGRGNTVRPGRPGQRADPDPFRAPGRVHGRRPAAGRGAGRRPGHGADQRADAGAAPS